MRRHKRPQAEDNPSRQLKHRRQPKPRRPPQPRQSPQPPQARGRCTRYVALHPLRGGAPEQKRCIAYGSGAVPQHTRTNAELAHRTTPRRTPPCAAGPYWRQDGHAAHAAHAATCTPAHSGPIRHLLHPYMRRAGFRVRPVGRRSRGDVEGLRDAEVAPLAQEVITPHEGKRSQRVRQPRQLDIRSANAV